MWTLKWVAGFAGRGWLSSSKRGRSWLWVCEHIVPCFAPFSVTGAWLLAVPRKHKGSDCKLWVCYGKKRMTGRTAVLAPTPWVWEQFCYPVWHMQWVAFALPWFANSSRGQEAVSALPGQPLRAGRHRVRIASVQEERKSQVRTAPVKIQLCYTAWARGRGETPENTWDLYKKSRKIYFSLKRQRAWTFKEYKQCAFSKLL